MNRMATAPVRLRRVSREQPVETFRDSESLRAAWRDYKANGSETLRNRLVEHYLYLVKYNAERIGSKLPDEVDVDDLMSVGIFGLMDAIDSFDLDRNVKFETFCAPRIRGAILDELRNMDWVPRLVRHRAAKLAEISRTLEAELGRAPTDDEISRRLGYSRAQFEKLQRDAASVAQVAPARKLHDPDTHREVFEIDVLPDRSGRDPVSHTQRHDVQELVTRGLTKAERLIITLYYYEEMTMKQIGQTLDLSESRVSQMHSAIIERLKEKLDARSMALAIDEDSDESML